ncbi:MAG: fibrillarin-like rRNA methylase [Acidobacteria bacterium]|jgi:precorrin-6B methylase 2|nr:fibrillarin-like rRNA methylase [Acidobacteriota bacterium]
MGAFKGPFGSAFFLLLACAAAFGGQEPKIEVEPWEVRINLRQPPMKVMDAIGLVPGMVIGEVGAGTGRVSVWLAQRVGPTGHVYANDIDERALSRLKTRCEKAGLRNLTTIVGTLTEPGFPPRSLDIAFMTNTYHHLEKPVELVRNLLPSLKEGGILAIVERDADRTVHKEEATSKNDFLKQMAAAGFEVIRIETFLQEDNIYIARPKPASK